MKSPTLQSLLLAAVTVSASLLWVSHADAGTRRGGGGGSFNRSAEGPRGGSVEAQGESYGRYRSGSVEATGPDGGTYNASGTSVGRFGTGSRSATGPNGGTYDASATRVGPYGVRNVNAQGANGGSYSSTTERFTGYRPNTVYVNGGYRPATIEVNSFYAAPLGAYAGWNILTQPYYIAYPVYATYPVQTAVQVELTREGYYNGSIDGSVGPATTAAIRKYQVANDLVATGTINQALLVSLGIQQS